MSNLSPERIVELRKEHEHWAEMIEVIGAYSRLQSNCDNQQVEIGDLQREIQFLRRSLLSAKPSEARVVELEQELQQQTARAERQLQQIREGIAGLKIAEHLDIDQDRPSHNRTINRALSLIDSIVGKAPALADPTATGDAAESAAGLTASKELSTKESSSMPENR